MIGLLFVKDLIFIDPEDETRVADFVEIFGRGVHVVVSSFPHSSSFGSHVANRFSPFTL